MLRLMVLTLAHALSFNFGGFMGLRDQVYAGAALTWNLLRVGLVEPSAVLDAVTRGKTVRNYMFMILNLCNNLQYLLHDYRCLCALTFWHRSFIFNSNKSPT